MLDALKEAAMARVFEALHADLEQAGRSLAKLKDRPESLAQMDPLTAWRLVHGLQASLEIAQQTLRAARRSPGMPAGPMRQAVTDVLALVAHVHELLHLHLIPLVERTYGAPPQGTRWRVEPPSEPPAGV